MFRSAFCRRNRGLKCEHKAASLECLMNHKLQGRPSIRLRQLLRRKEATTFGNSDDCFACNETLNAALFTHMDALKENQ